MATETLTSPETPGYELQDVSPRGLVYFLAIVAIFLMATSFSVKWLFGYFMKTDRQAAVVQPLFSHVRPLPPPPVVQANPGADIHEYLDSERRFLNSSGWIDKKNGIARIPIDGAMDLLLRQGLPVRNQNTGAPPTANHARAPAERAYP
jgi:hypothetical protein